MVFQFSNSIQQKVYTNLAKYLSTGLAAFYRDACAIRQNEPQLRSTTHLVAHLYREVESGLRDLLLGNTIDSELGALKKDAEIALKALDKRSPDVVKRWIGMIKDDGGSHAGEINSIVNNLKLSAKIKNFWLALAGKKKFAERDVRLHGLAHRDNLAEPRPFDVEFENFCQEMDKFLATITEAYASYYTKIVDPVLERLTAIGTPRKVDIKQYLEEFPNTSVAQREFFTKIGAGWLDALEAKNVFTAPPELEEGRLFNGWFQSIYLVRMSSIEPTKVSKIICKIKTENPYIVADFCEAALNMPHDKAAEVAKHIGTRLRLISQTHLAEKVAQLSQKLAAEGNVPQALELSRALLTCLQVSYWGQSAYFSPWIWNCVLEGHLEVLVAQSPVQSVEILVDLLVEDMKHLNGSETINTVNHSHMWRSRIPDGDQNTPYQILITYLWKALKVTIDLDPLHIEKCIDLLSKHPLSILTRITLYLVSQSEDSKQLVLWARKCDMMASPELKREYRLVLQKAARHLSDHDVRSILQHIEQDASLQSSPDAVTHWQWYWLGTIEVKLPQEWLSKYKMLCAEVGEDAPSHDYEPMFNVTTIWGDTSPLNKDDLLKREIPDIVSFLKDWQPDQVLGHPSIDGLAKEVALAVAEAPDSFSKRAQLFIGLPPQYLSALLKGIRDHLEKEGQKVIDWESLLELCKWMTTQSGDDWNWAHQMIADLLSSGIEKCALPINLNTTVWRLLKTLVQNDDPTPESEFYDEHTLNPFEKSLNTVSGCALNAVFKYTKWNHAQRGTDVTGLSPEIFQVLESRLKHPALSTRAVFGYYFGLLVKLDSNWASERISVIFPLDNELGRSAWVTYVLFNNPSSPAFALLRNQYATAIRALPSTIRQKNIHQDYTSRFGDHIMQLYARKNIDFEDDSGLTDDFFKYAPEELRRDTLARVGFGLKASKEIDPSVLNRFEMLWNKRYNRAVSDDFGYEMAAFGTWFVTQKFPELWALEQLKRALESAPQIQLDHAVIETLSTISPRHLDLVLDCLEMLLTKLEWGISVSESAIQKTLLDAFRLNEKPTLTKATEIANRLIAEGYSGYRELLQARVGSDKNQ